MPMHQDPLLVCSILHELSVGVYSFVCTLGKCTVIDNLRGTIITRESACRIVCDSNWVLFQYQIRRLIWRSQSLHAARFVFRSVRSLRILTCTSAAVLSMCLSNFKAVRQFKLPILRLRDFTRSYDKMPWESHMSMSIILINQRANDYVFQNFKNTFWLQSRRAAYLHSCRVFAILVSYCLINLGILWISQNSQLSRHFAKYDTRDDKVDTIATLGFYILLKPNFE